MATRQEVITRALRRLGVVAEDENPGPDANAQAGAVLDSIFAEVGQSVTVTWTLATVPDYALVPLANLLAAELAGEYPTSEARMLAPRSVAWMRLMGLVRADNRTDPRDIDESGTVDDDEARAGDEYF